MQHQQIPRFVNVDIKVAGVEDDSSVVLRSVRHFAEGTKGRRSVPPLRTGSYSWLPLGLASNNGGSGLGGGGGGGPGGGVKSNTYDDSSHNFEKGKNLEGISFDADNEMTSSSPLCRRRSVWTYCCPGIATATAATSEREGRPVESLRRDQVVMIVMSCFDCLLSCRRFTLGFVQASALDFSHLL
jgi:hypothetical protein